MDDETAELLFGLGKSSIAAGYEERTDVSTEQGEYPHVIDLYTTAFNYYEQKENYEVFNVGTGKGSSVLEVIQSFERVSGRTLNYAIADRRDGDIISAYADTTHANEELGWKAVSTLDDAMRSAWDWEKKIRNI